MSLSGLHMYYRKDVSSQPCLGLSLSNLALTLALEMICTYHQVKLINHQVKLIKIAVLLAE